MKFFNNRKLSKMIGNHGSNISTGCFEISYIGEYIINNSRGMVCYSSWLYDIRKKRIRGNSGSKLKSPIINIFCFSLFNCAKFVSKY